MFWLFALASTAGLILATPVLFQALTGIHPEQPEAESARSTRNASPSAFAGFALVGGGLGGLLALAFDPTDLVALVVALCLGLASAAMHPELVGALRKA